MKILVKSLIVGLSCLLFFVVPKAKATLEVGASISISATADFYAPLTPVGTWVEVGSYGRCWHPTSVAVGWRPYCDGYWAWTDCGWYWVSDEPWAWACYHYGSWVDDPHYGWIWTPGVEWAPAWVTWRYGGGYVGWAPIAPRVGFSVSVPAPPFFFVEVGSFNRPIRPSTVIVNNTTIINKTTVIGSVSAQTKTIGGAGPQKVMFNAGPSVTEVQKATGAKIQTTPIHEVTRQTPVPRTMERKSAEPQSQKLDQKSGGQKKEQAPNVREPSGTESKPKASPSEPAVTPDKPVSPKENKPRSREEFVPDKSSPGRGKPHAQEQVTPAPSESKKEAPAIREPSGTKSERKASPSEPAIAPEKPVAPKESKPRSREEFVPDKSSPPSQGKPHSQQIAPSPQRPAPSGAPPASHGKEKDEKKGHDKDHP